MCTFLFDFIPFNSNFTTNINSLE
jgi:hypothetical protein